VFNPDKTISYIQKGNANIFIDNMTSAKKYLKKSSSSSNVNLGIVKSVQKALNLRTREANVMLQNLSKIQPKHSIVRYNLALTYAQMGDIVQAQKHFLDSYHIDAKNYLSGIYKH
jgi:tetratricopeptide (TPR) repeat protein